MPRGRKTAVSQYERKRWLEDLEKGKGITEIAREAKRDIRIVKRHIQIAQQERETTQVRRDFLLGRLEKHQEDLFFEVERLLKLLQTSVPRLEPEDSLQKKYYTALKDHLHQHPLGKSLEAYSKLLQEYQDQLNQIRQALLSQEDRLVSNLSKVNLTDWSNPIISILEQSDLKQQKYDTGERSDHTYDPLWAGFHLTRSAISLSDLETLLQAHRLLVVKAEEFLVMVKEQRRKIIEAGPKIIDEMDILLVKRFIPGRCQYCPL